MTMSINRNTRSSSWAVAELLLPGGRIPGRNGDIWNSSRGCNPFWLMAQQPCGKPLVSILRQWLPCYLGSVASASALTTCGSWPTRHQTEQSVALQNCGLDGPWDLSRQGYSETDSVARRGGTSTGDFIWSLTDVDILSGWTQGGAV
jgi:hypothetical protein